MFVPTPQDPYFTLHAKPPGSRSPLIFHEVVRLKAARVFEDDSLINDALEVSR